ncbi:MAG: sodium:proton antiporter [Hyphomonadaceae bacterium]|nr:sodium:proton antiporter [Hyphomonadaceae bacterium]
MDSLVVLLPPLVALVLALVTRNIYTALPAGILTSETILVGGNPGAGFLESINRIADTFSDSGNVNVLLFSLIIGIMIVYMRDSGGVSALAAAMLKGPFSRTRRRAELSVATIGTGLFVETYISLFSTGILGRALYDAHKLSRERLAYIIDSTSSPVSVILLINAWGAYAERLVNPFVAENSTRVVVGSVGWNFYAFLALFLVFYVACSGKVFGPMKSTSFDPQRSETERHPEPTKPVYMWLPILLLVWGFFVFMYQTGGGNITAGNGSKSILWSIIISVLVLGILLRVNRVFSGAELQQKAFSGIGEMVPIVTIFLFALSFGASIRDLGTGEYVAGVGTAYFPSFAIPAALFVMAGIISFITGTSWGTYGILIPIAMPLAAASGIPSALALGAVLGGGVFGDHCSPISDSTLMASVASGSNHMNHVLTQLPYAVLAAVVSALLYLGAGVWTAV